MGFEPMTSAIPVQCSTNWANKPTGSWSLCWIQINLPKNCSCFRKKNRRVIWFNMTWLTVLLTMLLLFRMSSICLIIYFGVLICNILRQQRRKQQTIILTNLRLYFAEIKVLQLARLQNMSCQTGYCGTKFAMLEKLITIFLNALFADCQRM